MEQINKTQISCMERDELHNDTVKVIPGRMYGKSNKGVEKGKWNSQSDVMFTIHPNNSSSSLAGLDIPITYFNEIRKGQATKGKWFTEIKFIKVKSKRRRVEYVIPMRQVNMELDKFAQRNGLDSLNVVTIQNVFPKYAVCSNEGGTISLEEVCDDRRWNCEISLAAHVKVKSSTRSAEKAPSKEDLGLEAKEDHSKLVHAINTNYIALRNWFNGNLRVIFRNADCIREEGKKKTKANLTGEEDDLLYLEAYRCMERMLNSEFKEDEYEHGIVHTALMWIKESVESLGYVPHQVLPYEYNPEIDTVEEPIIYGYGCDECKQFIRGNRYMCKECPDYDMCTKCYLAGTHNHHKKYLCEKINKPQKSTEQYTEQEPEIESKCMEVDTPLKTEEYL